MPGKTCVPRKAMPADPSRRSPSGAAPPGQAISRAGLPDNDRAPKTPRQKRPALGRSGRWVPPLSCSALWIRAQKQQLNGGREQLRRQPLVRLRARKFPRRRTKTARNPSPLAAAGGRQRVPASTCRGQQSKRGRPHPRPSRRDRTGRPRLAFARKLEFRPPRWRLGPSAFPHRRRLLAGSSRRALGRR